MNPHIYQKARALVDSRQARDFSEACSMLSKRKKQKVIEPRKWLPYKDE